MKNTAELIDELEDHLSLMIDLILNLKKSHEKKKRGKLIYIKLVKAKEKETDNKGCSICEEEE